MLSQPKSVQHSTRRFVRESNNDCRTRDLGADLRCSCTTAQCQPLCETCHALAGLVPQISNQLRRYARFSGLSLINDDLSDLTQEVLLGLVRSGRPLDQLIVLIPCLSRRRLIDMVRRSIARPVHHAEGERIDEEAARSVMSDLALGINEAMERMSDAQRIIFVAHGIDRLTRRETAEVLGVSEGTVQHHYMRALAIVADVIGNDAS